MSYENCLICFIEKKSFIIRTFSPSYAQLFCPWDGDHYRSVDPRRWPCAGSLRAGTLAFDDSRSQEEEQQDRGSGDSGSGLMKNLLVKGLFGNDRRHHKVGLLGKGTSLAKRQLTFLCQISTIEGLFTS